MESYKNTLQKGYNKKKEKKIILFIKKDSILLFGRKSHGGRR